MKSPLRYQVTEYDCGPTTMTNAIMYLFDREEIPPDLVSHIGQSTLDSYDTTGHCGMYGTSGAAIRYFGSWLNELRYAGLLPIRSRYLEKEDVFFGEGSELSATLKENGAIVLHIFQETGHYILVTGEGPDGIRVFDPYYRGEHIEREGVIAVMDQPFSHNLLVSKEILNDTSRGVCSMGEISSREAILIKRDDSQSLYMI